MTFKDKHYEIVRGAISNDLLKYLQIMCDVHENANLFCKSPTKENLFPFSDDMVKECFSWYGSAQSETLMVFLKEKIELIVEKELYETYSYYRTYYTQAELKKHIDRPSCEYSATVCIQKDRVSWPIFFETLDRKIEKIDLEDGDLIIYKGAVLPHWREKFQGNKHRQIFTHYVDKQGIYKNCKYDTRPVLGLGVIK